MAPVCRSGVTDPRSVSAPRRLSASRPSVEEPGGGGAGVARAVDEGDRAAQARAGGADGGAEAAGGAGEGVGEEGGAGAGEHEGDERVPLGRLHADVGADAGLRQGDVDGVAQRRSGGAEHERDAFEPLEPERTGRPSGGGDGEELLLADLDLLEPGVGWRPAR